MTVLIRKLSDYLVRSISIISTIGIYNPSYSQGFFWEPKIQRNVWIIQYTQGFESSDKLESWRECSQKLEFRFFTERHFDQSISKGIRVVSSRPWQYQIGSRGDFLYGGFVPLICGGTKYIIEGRKSLVDGLFPDGSEI